MLSGYVSMAGRQKAIVAVLFLVIAVDVFAVVSSLMELGLLGRAERGETVTTAEAESNDDRQAMVGIVQLVLYITAAVFFIRWLRLGYRNADVVAPGLRRYGHGWAIGAWFVPFLNLWRPKQIVNDAWRAGAPSGQPNDDAEDPPLLLNLWWGAWILTNVLGQIAGRLAFSAEELDELKRATTSYIVSDGFDIVTAILAIAAVRAVTRRLEARSGTAPFRPLGEPPAQAQPWPDDATPERPAAPAGWQPPAAPGA